LSELRRWLVLPTAAAERVTDWRFRSRLPRTLAVFVLAALLVAVAWARLEATPAPRGAVAWMVGLALLPALVAAVRRHWFWVGLTLAAATVLAGARAFELNVADARPRDAERDFFGPLLSSIRQGFYDYYDTTLPFTRADFPYMHSLVLLAIFAFVAAAGILVAWRRPVAAGAVLVVATGWPATLAPGGRPLLGGALALVGVLALLFLLSNDRRPLRGLPQAAAAALVLVAVAAAASTTNAVAKPAFLSWQGWDVYDRPKDPVSVRYIWNSHYQGIRFPDEETVVLRVHMPGPRRSLYWRATTLDEYTGTGWRENLRLSPQEEVGRLDTVGLDPLLPERARDETRWLRQNVTVGLLSDRHLIASSQPVRWQPGEGTAVQTAQGDVVVLPRPLAAGRRYTAWSYVANAKPSQLANAPAEYGDLLRPYLELVPGAPLPDFWTSSRNPVMQAFFAGSSDDFLIRSYAPLYEEARRVVGDAATPYAAAVALEAWFRTEGGFVYDEQPPQPTGAEPPLVAFALQTKQGYCQHYAGAMAVMLRLLGVPARVAVGFTSGQYDEDARTWTVTDHNAHAWVEVYFPGWGWLPFDPTPGRGQLPGAYSIASPGFDGADASASLVGSDTLDALRRQEALAAQGQGLPDPTGGLSPAPEGGGGVLGAADEGPSLFGLAVLVVLLAAGGLLAAKEVRRALRFRRRDGRGMAAACRRDLAGWLADQGIKVSPSATHEELGALLQGEYLVDAGPFVRTVERARYARPADADAAAHRARRELRYLRKRLRAQLSLVRRLRGAFSLRSLAA
jgi:transglutaminase-like putative cysteine protease